MLSLATWQTWHVQQLQIFKRRRHQPRSGGYLRELTVLDVCLILEGTYPYVSGGVATWVHQLVSAMRDIKFGIVHIAPFSDPNRTLKYDLPQQVVMLKDIYLHDYNLEERAKCRPQPGDYEVIKKIYDNLHSFSADDFYEFARKFRGETDCFDFRTIFQSEKVWNILTEYAAKFGSPVSFVDYFWTWRATHLPLLQIMRSRIPRARIYHSISTGYAGLLGALAKIEYGSRYFLTEHGIYTYERMLEIAQANWIYEQSSPNFRASAEVSFFKAWWIKLFQVLSRITYQHADKIFTLYEGNRIREIIDGAAPEKISIIPNGIDVARYLEVRREKKDVPQIGLVGRVVSIKDVKTFIQAAQYVRLKRPNVKFYVIGPTDEEEEYYEECTALVEALGLGDSFEFTGRADVMHYYSFLDVVVLTSISEAQPYIILEANMAGIPIVATDVGACREMLDGCVLEDRELGSSGLVTPVSNPVETGEAILRLLNDKDFYAACSASGKKRVRKYYDQDDLLSRYLNIYEQNL